MTNKDWLLITSLTAVGVLIGFVVRWRLSALEYRHDDEARQPHPGPRWWIPLATAAASGLLAWRFGVDRWPLLLPTLPLAWFGPWLSAIDLDVRRLPNRLLGVHAALVAAGAGAAAVITNDAATAIQATLGGVVAFSVFWVLDRLRPGGFGWGDGKYVPVLGAATGAVGLNVTWWAFLIASLAALAATPFRRQRANFPFGPWLAAGGAISVVLLG